MVADIGRRSGYAGSGGDIDRRRRGRRGRPVRSMMVVLHAVNNRLYNVPYNGCHPGHWQRAAVDYGGRCAAVVPSITPRALSVAHPPRPFQCDRRHHRLRQLRVDVLVMSPAHVHRAAAGGPSTCTQSDTRMEGRHEGQTPVYAGCGQSKLRTQCLRCVRESIYVFVEEGWEGGGEPSRLPVGHLKRCYL